MWVDNWHPNGPILRHYGSRIIYDAGSNVQATVAEFISNNEWHMPRAMSRDLIGLRNNLPGYRPNDNREDTVEWVHTKNRVYTCKSAYEAIRGQSNLVIWADLLWHGDHIPRCSMIGWLACRNRLSTRDRLQSWGVTTERNCAESRDHLFCNCVYARQVWDIILGYCNMQYRCLFASRLGLVVALYTGLFLMNFFGSLPKKKINYY